MSTSLREKREENVSEKVKEGKKRRREKGELGKKRQENTSGKVRREEKEGGREGGRRHQVRLKSTYCRRLADHTLNTSPRRTVDANK